jgi:hypothetical protein
MKEFTDLLNHSPLFKGVRGDQVVFLFPEIALYPSVEHNPAQDPLLEEHQ